MNKSENKIYTIAEMSANHAGKLENALAIVRAAKDAGASCVKIQTYMPDSMTIDCDDEYFKIKGGLWDGYNLYKLYGEAYTPWEWQGEVKTECDRLNIDFLSTPFDTEAVDFLDDLGVTAFKIASFELVDIPLIRYTARKGKPMIVSTGMGSLEEVDDAVSAILSEGLKREQITLLKCTSEYPASTSDMNLLTIPDMIKRFGTRVGLSDHSIGTLAPVSAVALGATIIEKHFCLDRAIKNPDSEFSSEPKEFAEMVTAVNETAAALGSTFYGASSEKEKSSMVFRRSIFAVKDIKQGESFTKENVRIIRPGYGLKPKFYDGLIGRQSSKAYKRGEPITAGETGV